MKVASPLQVKVWESFAKFAHAWIVTVKVAALFGSVPEIRPLLGLRVIPVGRPLPL
jgi:hypothetical protein